MLYEAYFKKVFSVLEKITVTQHEKIEAAANILTNTFSNKGILYVFGCGHSHIISEDLFYRAGGMAPICPILDSDLMLHEGAVKSSYLEKMPGLAKPVFERYRIKTNDAILVVSTSGINSVPVEMALCAKEYNVPCIVITSSAYYKDKSRHPSGLKLCDIGDVVIDNFACHGDASVSINGTESKIGPTSTIASVFIAQAVVIESAQSLMNRGIEPPVYVSGNIPGGMEKNQQLITKYMPKIRHL